MPEDLQIDLSDEEFSRVLEKMVAEGLITRVTVDGQDGYKITDVGEAVFEIEKKLNSGEQLS